MSSEKKHNGIISVWKFIFSIVIIVLHAKAVNFNKSNLLVTGGSIGVEFFFIVSGYLFGKKLIKDINTKEDKNIGSDTINFMKNKLKVFLPFTICSVIIGILALTFFHNVPVKPNINSIYDMFLLNMTGIKYRIINGPLWYISSMLIVMFLLYPLIRKYKHNFIYVVLPLIIMFGFSYLNQRHNNITAIHQWGTFTYDGNIRAICEISIGILIYMFIDKIQKVNFTNFARLILTGIEVGGFAIVILAAQFLKNSHRYDTIWVLLLTISILLAFSEKTFEYKLLCNKFSYWLEKMSFPMFVFHYPICLFMMNIKIFKAFTYYENIMILIAFTLGVSLTFQGIVDYIKANENLRKKFKRLFIKEEKCDC